jgi:hypothetical protein
VDHVWELAEQLQAATGIRTTQLLQYWIGPVLGRVARSQPPDEPALTSFVVQSNGTIGSGYVEIIRGREPTEPADIEELAAHERLACHQHFGAELPPDGGKPVYTHEVRSRRVWQRAQRSARPPSQTCPACYTQLPLSGVCDGCG